MADFKAGDKVKIKTRELTNDDAKSGLYYAYFSGLTGLVDRIYDDGTVCINVDIDSLSADARARHLAMQEAERKRWLEGLSGEARSRLTEEQRQLRISYKILVSKNDIEINKGDKPSKAIEDGAKEDPSETDKKGPASAPVPGSKAISEDKSSIKSSSSDKDEPKRLTEADLAAKEEEFIRSLQQS